MAVVLPDSNVQLVVVKLVLVTAMSKRPRLKENCELVTVRAEAVASTGLSLEEMLTEVRKALDCEKYKPLEQDMILRSVAENLVLDAVIAKSPLLKVTLPNVALESVIVEVFRCYQ